MLSTITSNTKLADKVENILPEPPPARVFPQFVNGANPPYLWKMHQVDHIGIAVRDLQKAVPLFESLLNSPCYKTEEVASENVRTAFFLEGKTKVELLESTDPDGVIARFLAKKGEGLHHIAFEVTDITAEMKRLQALGFELLQAAPKRGADNKLVCFLHPKSTNGVLIELCQTLPA